MPVAEHTPSDLQVALSEGNARRFGLAGPRESKARSLVREAEHRALEHRFLLALRDDVCERAADAPTDPDAFVSWFEALERTGPGQRDPLHRWLASTATRAQIRWFVGQELSGEAGFADVLALTQVGMPPGVKLAMASNYWDEMGRGKRRGMHDPMLAPLAEALDLPRRGPNRVEPLAEALAVGNLMAGLAWNRGWVWHSVGSLGVVELTAPGRCAHVVDALARIGLPPTATRYYRLHATLDVRHSEEWDQQVLRPAVAQDPSRARWIAEGALMRLTVGARSYAAYRQHFG